MPTSPSRVYSGYALQPVLNPEDAETMAVALAPSISLRAGTLVGELSATPGVFTAYNQPALAAPSGAPTASDSGTAGHWPATAIKVGYTYLANGGETTIGVLDSFTPVGSKLLHIAILSVPTGASGINIYAGASATTMQLIGTTTSGAAADYDVPAQPTPTNPTAAAAPPLTNTAYVRAPLAPPSAGPTVTDSGTAGNWAVEPLLVGITFLTAGGETTPTWTAFTPVGAKELAIATVTLPSGATGMNIYAGESEDQAHLIGTTTSGTGASYNTPTAGSKSPPTVNTATAGDGSDVAKGVLQYDCSTDVNGNIVNSYVSGQSEFPVARTSLTTAIFWRGTFNTADLIGLDANAVSQLGRLIQGTITDGILEVI